MQTLVPALCLIVTFAFGASAAPSPAKDDAASREELRLKLRKESASVNHPDRQKETEKFKKDVQYLLDHAKKGPDLTGGPIDPELEKRYEGAQQNYDALRERLRQPQPQGFWGRVSLLYPNLFPSGAVLLAALAVFLAWPIPLLSAGSVSFAAARVLAPLLRGAGFLGFALMAFYFIGFTAADRSVALSWPFGLAGLTSLLSIWAGDKLNKLSRERAKP